MMIARELSIIGSVQGVGFRWTAKRIADGLGLPGWVRNNPDGSVSLAVAGRAAAVNEFIALLEEAMGGYIADLRSKDLEPGTLHDGFVIVR